MPEFLERKLASQASKKGLSGKRKDAYIYGTMNNLGAMKGSKETAKGKNMQKKHNNKLSGSKTKRYPRIRPGQGNKEIPKGRAFSV